MGILMANIFHIRAMRKHSLPKAWATSGISCSSNHLENLFYTSGSRLWTLLNKHVCCMCSSMGPRICQWKRENRNWKKKPNNFPPMIMKVFGITVNRRKPCTKEQAERGDETEKYCGLAQCGALQYFSHLVGHKNSDCHQICCSYSRTVRQLHLLACQMQCWSVCAREPLYGCFPKWQIYIFKTTFTMIILTLLFLLFKRDEAFHVVGMTGKTLSTHLDSFPMLTTAPKSKLKVPRCDSGAHVDAAPFWEGRTEGNFQTFHSHRALLGPTASNTFHLGHCIHISQFPLFTCALN